MRLWHKSLISVLPRQQLSGQLRECVLIAKNIYEKGKPNHSLVNCIMSYDISHFNSYVYLILQEMKMRKYNVRNETIAKLNKYVSFEVFNGNVKFNDLFRNWHDETYLDICFYNLLEKFKCNAIELNEWNKILKRYYNFKKDYVLNTESFYKGIENEKVKTEENFRNSTEVV